ncbi:MAG: hypothetical protein ACYS18_10940, partial [Planctomycetota bacterium]
RLMKCLFSTGVYLPEKFNSFIRTVYDAWLSEFGDLNWDAGCDISEPNDNVIDGLGLGVFVGNWLEGV